MRATRPLAITAVLAASLALAGCAGGSETTSGGGEGTSPDEVTEDAPEFDVEAIDLGEPGDTEPGTTLALGEPAWVITQVTPSGSDTAEDVQMGLTLLDITEGSTEIWAGWETEDEFEGFTPYLMVIQYSYPNGLPEGVESPPNPAIFPLLEDGSGASFIEAQNFGMGAGASDVCGYTLQGWDSETNTNVVCAVGLSEAGPVTGGLFNGDNWSGILQGWDETYGDSPIIWE